MTPTQKATKVFKEGAYDTQLVLQALAARSPQLFLEVAAQYKCKVSQVPTATLKVQVARLIREDKYVNAIKLVRQETGKGLREAKDYCDEIRGDNPIQQPSLSRLEADFVRVLITRNGDGDKVRAVKYIREVTGLGLKESLLVFDTLKRTM